MRDVGEGDWKKVIIAVLFRHKEATGLWIFKRILVHAQLKS